ncbi:glycosyl hydrolase 115 family protein [Streptomyces sp. NPDC048179]|uniref:glycosyl hydrolase 115 family protein n=1 Tax=Streptomyces sp. NPDC048179 TaxID=3365506 RepID=UPI0037123834
MSVRRRTVLGAGLAAVPVLSSGVAWAGGDGAPQATDPGAYISFTGGAFPLVGAPVVVSADDHPGVVRVAGDLRDDIERVTGVRPAVAIARRAVLVGTIGRSPLIDGLVAAGKLDVTGVRGRWETSLQTVVDHPLPGVDQAFVIAGSDPRGTIFGAYDVSYGIGVSPWHWWDDVLPVHRDEVWVLPGRHTQGTPAVKYRGFFINDENPALGTWAPAYFGPGKAPGYPGGFNADFYAKVFEVLLRLKGNYLWPAVWGRAFAEDDPENHRTASAYGVVMGTSHEAPMMRGIEEWNRHATGGTDPYGGTGEWSYLRNAEAIRAYWRAGIQRMVDEGFEGVVTLGMRGNGDTGLPDGDGIELMQEIIAAQRQIIEEVTGRPAAETPQVWTLYKEVQRYWDRGLRAPDDVTVVLTDDNWGNIRKHPSPAEPRGGGYGLYYHFDYVGAGRNYKWVDTANLRNVWDQLHQAHAYGNHGLWVANVGDLKGNELPTEFFLDYAWDPQRWSFDRLGEWERRYARQNFGAAAAGEVAELLAEYGRLQARRKPELLNRRITLAADGQVVYDDQQTPFSFGHRELERVTGEWRELGRRAARIGRRLPEAAQDAWFELVGYEVAATANLYALREAEFTNLRYAREGRAATNDLATAAEAGLAADLDLADRFNSRVAGGKWRGFQTQPHIDYGDVDRYGPNAPWQQPEKDNVALPDVLFPAVRRIEVPEAAGLGVSVDGDEPATALPPFSPYQTRPQQFVEVFNRGRTPFDYRVTASVPWLVVDHPRGRVTRQVRLEVRVDWSRAPAGRSSGELTVSGAGESVTVGCVAERPPSRRALRGFVEAGGYVAIDADHYDRAAGQWRRLAGIGRTGAGMTAWPVTGGWADSAASWPRLEYEVSLLSAGEVTVWTYLSPRNPTLPTGPGLHYALSFDDQAPQQVDITAGADDGLLNTVWARNTSDHVNRTSTRHTLASSGVHRLKFWSVDPTVVVQRLVLDTGGLTPTYLGPLESRRL